MPLLLNYNAVFIHIPKVAGTSVLEAFGLFEHPKDGRPTLYGPDPTPKGRRYLHHLTAVEAISEGWLAGKEDWYRFAFVRNPWDRVKSSYCFQRGANWIERTFEAHVALVCRLIRERDPRLFITDRPQHEFLYDSKGQLLVSAVGRYEHLQESFDAICRKLGKPPRQLKRINRSRRDEIPAVYTPRLVDMVQEAYKEDWMRFGYEFKDC